MDVMRNLVVKFPLYENDIINYVCTYLCDENFFYHDSIENYVIKKEPILKRKFYYQLYNMVLLLFLLKYLLVLLNPNEIFKIYLGELFFIWMSSQYNKAYIFIVLLCLFTIMLKMMLFYQEIHYKLKALNLLRNLGKELPFYELNSNKHDTLKLLTNILFWILRFISIQARIILSLILLILILYIKIFMESEFSIIILLISAIHAYLFYKHLFVILIGGVVSIFIMIIFLNWKLDEIIKSMRLRVLWRNKVRLLDNMMTYNKFTKLVHKISRPINYAFGLIFLITPSLISASLIILKNDANTLIEMLVHFVLYMFVLLIIILVYTMNHFCASIPLRNRSIANFFLVSVSYIL